MNLPPRPVASREVAQRAEIIAAGWPEHTAESFVASARRLGADVVLVHADVLAMRVRLSGSVLTTVRANGTADGVARANAALRSAGLLGGLL